jgi:hypothetical protein
MLETIALIEAGATRLGIADGMPMLSQTPA